MPQKEKINTKDLRDGVLDAINNRKAKIISSNKNPKNKILKKKVLYSDNIGTGFSARSISSNINVRHSTNGINKLKKKKRKTISSSNRFKHWILLPILSVFVAFAILIVGVYSFRNPPQHFIYIATKVNLPAGFVNYKAISISDYINARNGLNRFIAIDSGASLPLENVGEFTFSRLVAQEIISQELLSTIDAPAVDVNSLWNEVSKNVKNPDMEILRLYGWNQDEYREYVIYPEAQSLALASYIESQNGDYEKYLNTQIANSKIVRLIK